MSITLTLGGITFQGFELPERLPFGGSQHVVKHQMVGGARQVHAMGTDFRDPSWTGRFRGSSAYDRANILERLMLAGTPVTMSCGPITWRVVISEFTAEFERGGFEIPYSITLVRAPLTSTSTNDTANTLVSKDMLGLNGLMSSIGGLVGSVQGVVTGALSSIAGPLAFVNSNLAGVGSLISTVGSLTGQSFGQLSPILTGLSNAQGGINGVLQIASGQIFTGIGTIGGVFPSSPSAAALNISSQIGALQASADAVVARGTVGRLINNVGKASSSP